MKPLPIIIIIIVVVIAGLIFMQGNTAEAPKSTNEVTAAGENTATEDDTNLTEDEATSEEDTPAGETRSFEISGTNYAYDVSEIRVQEGDTVTINFVSDEGYHDWVVDEFAAATEKVQPGTPTSVTFVADTAGTYEYYCSVGSHRANGMVGTLIVE